LGAKGNNVNKDSNHNFIVASGWNYGYYQRLNSTIKATATGAITATSFDSKTAAITRKTTPTAQNFIIIIPTNLMQYGWEVGIQKPLDL